MFFDLMPVPALIQSYLIGNIIMLSLTISGVDKGII